MVCNHCSPFARGCIVDGIVALRLHDLRVVLKLHHRKVAVYQWIDQVAIGHLQPSLASTSITSCVRHDDGLVL